MAATSTSGLGRLLAWTALDVAIAAAVTLGFGLLLALAFFGLKAAGHEVGPGIASLGGMPALFIPLSLVGTLLAGLVLWALHRQRLPTAPRPWSWRMGAVVVALALVLQAAVVAFTAWSAQMGATTTGSNLAIIQQAFEAAPVLTLLATILLAPVGEELVFRRVLLHRCAQAGRPLLGLFGTSLLFALIHEPLPGSRDLLAWALTLGTYAVLGIGFGALYLRTGRIDAVIAGHVLVNASGIALLFAS